MMFINEARLSVGLEGNMKEVQRETIDRFASLCKINGPHAQVGVNVGTSLNFGDLKIDVSVTLTCDQNEGAIDEAARVALEKGHELMNVGLTAHGQQAVAFDAAALWKVQIVEPVKGDTFSKLCSGRGPLAHIGVSAGMTIGYGDLKIKTNLRLSCDQTDERINEAGQLCITKTNEYVRWGLSGYSR
jgi:hypothetical protein